MEKISVIFFVASFLMLSVYGQDLEAKVCQARLPTKRDSTAAVYDGDDSVYVFGGMSDAGSLNTILKYSISRDTIETVGQLPGTSFAGGATMDKDGAIYYIGGSPGRQIYRFFPENGTVLDVASLPAANYKFSLVVISSNNTAILCGGNSNKIGVMKFDMTSLSTELMPPLPKEVQYNSALWHEKSGNIFIFGGPYREHEVTMYNPSTGQAEILTNYFPYLWQKSAAVWDGNFAYIIGGYGTTSEPENGIYQFDPDTREVVFLYVRGFPSFGTSRGFFDTSAVFVEKLNRIYMFGGYTSDGSIRYRDQIYSIDLARNFTTTTPTSTTSGISTLDPAIFDCSQRPDGFYPHPLDCSKFVGCRNTHAYEYQCPEPLLFDPVRMACNFPDIVECN